MKSSVKKSGFTLIELIAVIVVLAIILTITIPIISNIVTSARKASFKSDARLVLDQVRIQKNQNEEFDPTSISYDTLGTYNLSNQNYESLTISMVNNKPYIYVVGKNKWAGYKACGTYNNMGVFEVTELGTCQGEGPVTFPKVTDSNPGEICLDYSTDSTCYIKSVEDLVGFSKSVESGKDYLNKTVILVNGLDINSTKSYVNSNTTSLGDINGDGTTDGLLTEITTGKGFNPIGSDTKQFKGTFEGSAKTIGNLYINRPTQNYVGLFGYNSGIIRGLTITDENITGQNYTGGIAGVNSGNISTILVKGSVSGATYIGGVTGSNTYNKIINSVYVSANVTGSSKVGGLVGSSDSGISKGIVSNSNIVGTSIVGKANGYGTINVGVYSSTSVAKIGTCNDVCSDGQSYDDAIDNNLNAYDSGLDTWIAGDNDSDGYYFDYDSSNNIVVKSVANDPMTFSLNGSGTVESPYLINNYDEWKQAVLKANGNYVFKLTNDIDFANKNYYAFGSNSNYFLGTFEGSGYYLKNITTKAIINSGLFGYNNGTIRGINILNLNLLGETYVGGITGYNSGIISSISMKGGTISGVGNVGGIAGYNFDPKIISDVYVSSNVMGTSNVGGIVGLSSSGTSKGIVSNCDITGTGGVGKANGYGYINVGVYASTSITKTGRCDYCSDGISFSSTYDNNLTKYDDYGLDTKYGGDNSGDGYYFDYNSDSSDIIVKSIERNPITTTPVTSPETESDAGTDVNGSSCSMTGSCVTQGTTTMRCSYAYLYNSSPISGYQSGYTYSMTKGGSCATATADTTDGGLLIYVTKKSTVTGTCSVVLKINATGGTYNCASTKYSSFTFN